MEKVNHKQLASHLKQAWKTKIPVMIWGVAGIGKSDAIREFAKELAKEQKLEYTENGNENEKTFCLRDIRLSQLESVDLRGIPKIEDGMTKWFTPDWLPHNPNSQGIIFFDEANRSFISVMNACLELFLDRRLGSYCYSKDTRIMTKNGLKYFYELNSDDEIMTLNPINNIIEYHKPTDIIELDFNGKMIEFLGRSIDICVSPDHNMFVRKQHSYRKKPYKKKQFEFIKAKDLIRENFSFGFPYPKQIEIKRDGDWKGKKREYFEIPLPKEIQKRFNEYNSIINFRKKNPTIGSVNISKKMNLPLHQVENYIYYKQNPQKKYNNITKFKMEDWVEFLGWYLSEGCVVKTHHYEIIIYQDKIKNSKNYKEIKNLLERMGFHTNEIHNGSGIKIFSYILGKYLEKFGKAKDKFIPNEIKNLDKKYLQILHKTLLKGDGSENRKYFSISKKLIEDFAEISIKIGYGVTISEKNEKNKNKIEYKTNNKIYCVSLSTNNVTPNIKKYNLLEYNDKIYCVTVKNHIIMVERNGKFCWCGNCLPKKWMIILAGNPNESQYQVNSMSAPLRNRFKHFELKTPSIKEWGEWSMSHDINPHILGFLNFKPNYLFKLSEEDTDNSSFPSPRTWEFASKSIEGITDPAFMEREIASCVGKGIAIEFSSWYKMTEKVDLDAIIKNPESILKIKEISLKFAVVSGLAEKYRQEKKNLEQMLEVCKSIDTEFGFILLGYLRSADKNALGKMVTTKVWKEVASKYAKYLED